MARLTLDEWGARLQALGKDGLEAAVMPVFERGARSIERQARLSVRELFRRRTGMLINSISCQVRRGEGGRLEISATDTAPYARMQEKGGVQVPRNAKMLRIPLEGGPALTAAGVDRFGGPLRQVAPPGFFRLQKAMGKMFLVHDVGRVGKKGGATRGARVEFWYVLKRSVTIPARPFLQPAVEAGTREMGPALIRAVVRAIKEGPAVDLRTP